ncbi:MAG: hypothetical protein AAGG38_11480 [Planctomycetota bacterium]
MDYEAWRDEVFGQPPGSDPVTLDLSKAFYGLGQVQSLDFIDCALIDRSIHDLFSPDQIGFGLHLIYSNCCSDLPFCYTELESEERKVQAIENLRHLSTNYFDRYCVWPVRDIGNDLGDTEFDQIGFICYMFWDVFILHAGNVTDPMKQAAIGVMNNGLASTNDHTIVSAITPSFPRSMGWGTGQWTNLPRCRF